MLFRGTSRNKRRGTRAGECATAGTGKSMTQVRKILIADDDNDLRAALAEQLALHEEFAAVQADTAAKALATTRVEHPDLGIMDVGRPDMDGREAVKIMRKDGFKNPIIMLTGQASDADAVLGLEAGANDYVNKPFRFAVLRSEE